MESPADIRQILDAMSAHAASLGVTGAALVIHFPIEPGRTAETAFLRTGGVPVYSALSGQIADDTMTTMGLLP